MIQPATTEEGRAFLQRRIGLFGQIGFALSLFFFVFNHGLYMLLRPGGIQLYLPIDRSSLWHLTGASVGLVIWLITRSPRRRYSRVTLIAIDAAGTLLAISAYAMVYASGPLRATHEYGVRLAVDRTDLLMLLITVMVVTVRAIVVPCTVRHTAIVSLAGVLPAHALTWWLFSTFPVGEPPVSAAVGVSGTALWCASVIIIAVVTSRVIYGLRRQVVEAQRLGQYVLEEKIGEGGMGTVYRASHVLLRRPAALKLLRPERAGSDTVARFEREVKLTSRLTHPNTVIVFDYGHTPAGTFYYAMEYLDGIDLGQLVARHGAQPPARAIHILQQVCGSLAEAHGLGLVHRDIKPSNILVCDRGGVPDVAKVLDFGLAKDLGTARDATLTAADSVIGTPLYLSPEAIRDPSTLDGRADLYALGAVAYFLLSGAPPFRGATVVDVCAAHLHEPPAPLAGVPADLAALVLRCLAKDREARPQTAAALREALLACDVPAWTERDARAWWDAHRGGPAHHLSPESASGRTLEVDMLARSPRVEERAR